MQRFHLDDKLDHNDQSGSLDEETVLLELDRNLTTANLYLYLSEYLDVVGGECHPSQWLSFDALAKIGMFEVGSTELH